MPCWAVAIGYGLTIRHQVPISAVPDGQLPVIALSDFPPSDRARAAVAANWARGTVGMADDGSLRFLPRTRIPFGLGLVLTGWPSIRSRAACSAALATPVAESASETIAIEAPAAAVRASGWVRRWWFMAGALRSVLRGAVAPGVGVAFGDDDPLQVDRLDGGQHRVERHPRQRLVLDQSPGCLLHRAPVVAQ